MDKYLSKYMCTAEVYLWLEGCYQLVKGYVEFSPVTHSHCPLCSIAETVSAGEKYTKCSHCLWSYFENVQSCSEFSRKKFEYDVPRGEADAHYYAWKTLRLKMLKRWIARLGTQLKYSKDTQRIRICFGCGERHLLGEDLPKDVSICPECYEELLV
jgi:hypothetical protein